MYIINIERTAPYPPLQSWDRPEPPNGCAMFPEEFYDIFYPPDKRAAGFVDITVEDVAHPVNGDVADSIVTRTVTACVWNETLYQEWCEENPEQDEQEPEPTMEEIINTMLGV